MSASAIKKAGNITEVYTLYCPHCRAITNSSVTVITYLATNPEGKEEIVISKAYHCEACGLFVRSEEEQPFSEECLG